jgi:hypothetical protein
MAIRDKETEPIDGCDLYNAFISFFQKEMETDAFKLFTADKTTQNGVLEIQNYYAAQVKKFQDILQKNLKLPKFAEISRRFNMAIGNSNPTVGKTEQNEAEQKFDKILVKALNTAKADLDGEKFEVSKSIFDASVEQEQEQEQEVEQEQEQEQEIEQERDIDLIYQGNASGLNARDEEVIDVSFKEGSGNFANFTRFESVSARDDLAVLPTNKNFTNGKKFKNYGELLPDNFRVSKNFREVVAGDVHPLSPLRHEPVYFVLHVGKDGKPCEFCVVSEFEAKSMKGQLNNGNTFLYSLDGTLFEGDAERAKSFNAERENAINWIHFWHGDVEELQAAKNNWITKNLEQRDQSRPKERSNHKSC